jgi:hypothetical protein
MQIKNIPTRLMLCCACIAGLLLSAASSSAQQPNPESASSSSARPTGAISGRVINSGGEPLAGAIVYVSTFGTNSGRRATVDTDGNFKVDGLDALAYFVWASAPGFVSDPVITPNDARRYYHVGDSVNLTLTKGGVISGSVTSSTNTPVVNTTVRAFRVRDENGQPVQSVAQPRDRVTDDRGYYRIYGLPSGSYVISAGGAGQFSGFMPTQYEGDAPTYAPSSTRDTASEIVVRGGEEVTADIQYRGEAGHSVSGALSGVAPTQAMMFSGSTISLTDLRSRATVMSTPAGPFNNYGFAFFGVSEGEYEVFAQRYSSSGEAAISEARRIKVQGADVTGINLSLFSLASISGRLVLESVPKAECVKRRLVALQETVIGARRMNPDMTSRPAAKGQTAMTAVPISFSNQTSDSIPDAKGEFILRNLHNGLYRVVAQLPETGWYIRAITMGAPPAVTKTTDPNIPREGLTIKTGEKVSGVTVTITEGAASLRGHLSAREGQRVPAGLRVYLVPGERESAENVLRFFESATDTSAGFAIENIAPGRYWLIARAPDDGDPAKLKPIRQEPALRARVLREAEALKKEIAFKPCEQTSDYELPWAVPARQ